MTKYGKIALEVLKHVGGKENVENAFHCMTRLRLNLKDADLIRSEQLKAVPGVLGLNHPSAQELQVVIGTEVDDVYRAFIRLGGLEGNARIDENLDACERKKEKLTVKSVINAIVGAFSACMNPLVPMFVLVGTFNVIAALIGPSFLNLVSEESNLYTNFYYVGQAIIYFLPVLLAYPAAKYFKCNHYISLVLACLLLYPEFSTVLENGGYTVFGIPATNAVYTSSVLPVMLIVWAQSYVEKLANRISPKSMKVIAFPFFTVALMLPLTFCVLGPLGTLAGTGLANLVIGLRTAAGPVETMLVGGVVAFLTAFGIGRPIFFICMSMLFAEGVEYAYMPIAMVLTNFVAMGLSLGFAVKSSGEDRQLGITSFIACCLGGVSEPTWFGILLPHKKAYLPAVIGGAAGGLYLGLMNVGYYQFGPSNVLSVLGYISSELPANFLHGSIAAGIGFTVTFVMMLLSFKRKSIS